MDVYTAIDYICSVNAELEAMLILLKSHEKKCLNNFKDLCDKETRLRAICELNSVRYGDELINALSDIDNCDKYYGEEKGDD